MTPEVTAENPTDLPKSAPSTSGMTTKVVKGSLWTLAGQIAPLAVSLITTPFVIRMLGAESYGVLILVGLIPTYLGFADFGMGMASTKFASEAYADGDPEKEARIVRTAAMVSLCSSLPIALVLFVFSSPIISFFGAPEHLHDEASFGLKIAAATFVISFLNGIFNTPQLARLRMDLSTLVNSGFRIAGLIATPFAVYFSGIVGALLVLFGASVLTLMGHLYISRRLLPHLFDLGVERPAVRRMLKFGGALVGGTIAAMLLANVEKLVLPKMLNVKELAYYSVSFTFASMLTMFSTAMSQSLLPAFSQLQGPEKKIQLRALYERGVRLNLLWLVPALVLLSILAKPFFTIWAGADFGEASVAPFYVILAGLVFNIPAYLPFAAITAAGRTDVLAKIYWAELVPYCLLVWFCISQFGVIGAALAWSVRIMFDALFLFYFARRVTSLPALINGYQIFPAATFFLLVPFCINLYEQSLNWIVLVSTFVGLILYSLTIWRFLLSTDETSWIADKMSRRFGINLA